MAQDDLSARLEDLKLTYQRANRCWRSNNLQSCLRICNQLTTGLAKLSRDVGVGESSDRLQLSRLENLVWFLKIRCISDDYYVNESLLLNQDDIETEGQVRTISSSNRGSLSTRMSTSTRAPVMTGDAVSSRRLTTATNSGQQRTAILTGKTSNLTSRYSGRQTTSYRPLTTGLTATQTAFSRSTRPILKYSANRYLSKPHYEYLYNAQTVANKCPDYRQCLEYLNLVKSAIRKESQALASGQDGSSNQRATLIQLDDVVDDIEGQREKKSLGAFWLLSYGICYFNLHMNREAEEHFKLSMKSISKCLDAYTWLIKVYLRTNQPIKVLRVCEKGLANCKNPILYNWMARVQGLICDSYAANQSLTESLKFYPTNVEALANEAYFCFYGDKQERALKCYQRIEQLTSNQLSTNADQSSQQHQSLGLNSTAELLNNLAICNFYCGNYHQVIPLFQRAFLSSPSKEVTSDIWYNLSFIPINCGMKNLAIACLRLALKNDSQNEEAINNLGVLMYGELVNEDICYENKQELWGQSSSPNKEPPTSSTASDPFPRWGLVNLTDQQRQHQQATYNELESYFCTTPPDESLLDSGQFDQLAPHVSNCVMDQPEMMYNMALVKRRRGQLLASSIYCRAYLEIDQTNYFMRNLEEEIRELVSHDN